MHERIGLKKYDEWQTESNRLQGERSAGRTKTERNKQEEHVSQWKNLKRQKRDEHLPLRGTKATKLYYSPGHINNP